MQNLLFKSLQLKVTDKDKVKDIINKANSKSKTKTVIGSSGGNKTQIAITTARQLLIEESRIGDLRLATNEIEVIDYFDKIIRNGICSLDSETDSLSEIDAEIAGISLFTKGEKAIYIPMNHVNYINGERLLENIAPVVILNQLKRLEDTNVKIIFHNAKYDMKIFRWGFRPQYAYKYIDLKPYWDTMIAGNLLNENEPHNLKDLWGKYCNNGLKAVHFNTLFDGVKFKYIPLDLAFIYAAKDALMTWELYLFQKKTLERESLKGVYECFKTVEMPVIYIVANMEDNGCKIDVEFANKLTVQYTEDLKVQEKEIYKEIEEYKPLIDLLPFDLRGKLGNPINLNSPTQLAILIYDVLKLKSPIKKKPRGTGEEIIETFKLPLFKKILEYRGLAKLISTYTGKIPECVNPQTNHVHCSFNQKGAKTGRFSSSEPNLQNIPSHNKNIRKMFVADEGYYLCGGDFSQQEPKVLAHMSQDETMIQAYIEDKDLYATVASVVYHKPYEECKEFTPDGVKNPEGKDRRTNCKSIILGIMYSRGAKSISEQIGSTKQEAQDIIDNFFIQFPKVKIFVDNTIKNAKTYGFVETAYGRKRRLPDMQLPEIEIRMKNDEVVPENMAIQINNEFKKLFYAKAKSEYKAELRNKGIIIKDNGGYLSQAERQCVNSIIQGTSASITKLALIAIGYDKRMKELGFKLMITVHDEIIGEAPIANIKEASERLGKLMIECCKDKISVAMKCDTEITQCWYGSEIEL